MRACKDNRAVIARLASNLSIRGYLFINGELGARARVFPVFIRDYFD